MTPSFLLSLLLGVVRLGPGQWLALGLLWGLAGPAARAQAPAWQTAVAAGGNSAQVNATAVDAGGNVYVAGYFSGTATFGSTTLTSAGGDDVFVAKWSPASASFVWAQQAGGTSGDQANALAVSGPNIYVSGSFGSATAAFGSIALANTNGSGTADVFVAKLIDAGSSGSFGWAQRAGGAGDDRAYAVAVSGTSVYVAGNVDPPATFGSIALAALTTSFGPDAFVAKLTDAGSSASFGWVQRGGAAYAFALAANGANVYMAGFFIKATAVFGNITLTNADAGGSADVYVAKLTDAGASASFGWVQRAGGTGADFAKALAVNGPNVYVSGHFESATTGFGTTTLTNASTFAGGDDVFVAKLTDAGATSSFAWARQAGGAGNDYADAVAVNGPNVYLGGYFYSPTASFGATTLNRADGILYLARLTDAGPSASFAWAQQASINGDNVKGVAVSGAKAYVAGHLGGAPASFGQLTIPSYGGFLASLTDAGALATAVPAPLAGVSLAPNPAHATATVRVPAVPGTTQATLQLTDALGRVVRAQRLALPAAGGTAEVPLLGLAPGLYRLVVQAGAQRVARALAVE